MHFRIPSESCAFLIKKNIVLNISVNKVCRGVELMRKNTNSYGATALCTSNSDVIDIAIN